MLGKLTFERHHHKLPALWLVQNVDYDCRSAVYFTRFSLYNIYFPLAQAVHQSKHTLLIVPCIDCAAAVRYPQVRQYNDPLLLMTTFEIQNFSKTKYSHKWWRDRSKEVQNYPQDITVLARCLYYYHQHVTRLHYNFSQTYCRVLTSARGFSLSQQQI